MASRIRTVAAAAGVAAALALPACGGEEPPAEPLGQKLGGSVATLANCGDWAGGARARKLATIADIRNQVNRDDTGVEAPPLSDDEAMRLFDRRCAASYARGFRLYVLYARAAGWAPLLRNG
jgi:hypothetical protein